ncbi:MAG: DUF4357 domain-containing protein [Acholeplasmatales bacterium]|nr:MAG: DUF4357 domain-containing protein [Acholeplasmatales bacterium]
MIDGKDSLYFYLTDRSRDVIARGRYPKLADPKTKDTHFYLLKGSFLLKKAKFDQLHDLAGRREIEAHYVTDAGHYLMLTEDRPFKSPSHAASMIVGRDVKGETLWFDAEDTPLVDLMK